MTDSGRLNQHVAKTIALAAALFTAACAGAPRNPVLDKYPSGVVGRTTVLYYDVHGRTFAEVRADMHRRGPKVNDSSWVGETRSPMRYRWRTESMGGASCSIRDATVMVNAQITLPRWTPPPDTEPGLAAEWNRFIAALETHEAGHKDISAKAGRAIGEQLRGLSGLCSMISARATDVARGILAKASEEQAMYDALTRHGLTQGTSFGPRRFAGGPTMLAGTSMLNAPEPLTLLARPRAGTVRGFLAVPLERAWSSMRAAYAASDLAVNDVDSVAHAVGDLMLVRGRIGAVPVSEVVDCGTPPTGANADSVDVALFVTSRLEPAQPSGSMVTNTVQAVARPKGVPPIACRSRGVLERRLLDALRGLIAR